jgi:hypothetical protein
MPKKVAISQERRDLETVFGDSIFASDLAYNAFTVFRAQLRAK